MGSVPSPAAQGPVPDKFGPSVPPANIRARGTAVGEDTPRPSSPIMAAGKGAAAPTDVPGPSSTRATDFVDSHEGPSVDPAGQGGGSGVVSLSDFSPAKLLNHFISNDIYFGKGWEQVRGKSCNSKMEFFFNCHSLVISSDLVPLLLSSFVSLLPNMFDLQMMSEMANTYRRANKALNDNKRLQKTISRSAAEKLSAEE